MELTNAQIHDFAGSEQIYEKGKQLYAQQAIVSLDIDDFSHKEIILINATVCDDKHYYEVNLSIDKDDVTIRAHLCTCKEHSEHIISCSHCVAVLCKLQDAYEGRNALGNHEIASSDSAAITIMNTYEQAIMYASLASNLKQAIHLEPVVEIRKRSILAITLKVGNEKQYIIRDIAQLLDDIKHNEKRLYGKDLEFIHNINSFDEESQKLIRFLSRHVYDIHYFQSRTALQSAPQARNLCMTPEALDVFYTMHIGEDVMYRMKEKTLINMRFIDENPRFHIDIKQEGTTYQLLLSADDLRIFEGEQHTYVLHNYCLHRCDVAFTAACTPFLKAIATNGARMHIAEDIMPAFYNNVIMSIRDHIVLEGVDISQYAPQPLECQIYVDMPRYHVISARLIYVYGDVSYPAFTNQGISSSRNYNDEITMRLSFTRYMTRIDAAEGIAYIENSQDAIYEFLSSGLEELGQHCEIFASEKFRKLSIRDAVHINMGVRIESDLLQIDFDTYDFPIDELQNVLKAYRLNKKYYRMKNGSFVNLEDSALSDLSAMLDGMHVSDEQLQSGRVEVPKYRSLYLDSALKEAEMIKVERDQSFKNIIRGMKNVVDSDYEVPKHLKSILRNYQKAGFRWLRTMSDYGFGGILADDMGIGKTLQVITLFEDEKQRNPKAVSLVICPSSLLLNWQSEIEKFSDTLGALVISGSAEERQAMIRTHHHYDVLITSYDYVKRDISYYEDITFTYEIIDEAQYIKNHTTKNATSVKAVHAIHRFALTGTPIENSLAELWSIFDYLMSGYLYTYNYFRKHFELPIVKENDQTTLRELKHMVEPFILRRVKKDVLKELPEKVEHTMMIELDEENRKLYMANVASIRDDLTNTFTSKGFESSKIMVLTMLTRLRQLCCDPRLLYENYHGVGNKVRACMEYIETCRQSGKKVLLFSQFTSLLALIEKELHAGDIPYYLLKGSTPKPLRQQYVNAFNIDKTPVFLISLKAGGTGLNLTSAEVVIHFDPWWNISAQNQATDRAYRIGQHNNVQVIKLIAKDTIEEKIMMLQEQKKDLSDSIIHQNEGLITSMNKDDIMNLF